MWSGNIVLYDCHLFSVRINGSLSRADAWNGTFCSSHAAFDYRNRRNKNYLDLCFFSSSQNFIFSVSLVSFILDLNNYPAGHLLLFCSRKSLQRIPLKKNSIFALPKENENAVFLNKISCLYRSTTIPKS